MANKEEALEKSSKTKILLCFHDNSQHQQSGAKPKCNKHSTTVVAVKEHLTDRQQESGLKLKTAQGMFCPLLLVSSVCHLLSFFCPNCSKGRKKYPVAHDIDLLNS